MPPYYLTIPADLMTFTGPVHLSKSQIFDRRDIPSYFTGRRPPAQKVQRPSYQNSQENCS